MKSTLLSSFILLKNAITISAKIPQYTSGNTGSRNTPISDVSSDTGFSPIATKYPINPQNSTMNSITLSAKYAWVNLAATSSAGLTGSGSR